MTDEHKANSAEQEITSDAAHLLSEAESTPPQPAPVVTPEAEPEVASSEPESESESEDTEPEQEDESGETGPPVHLERLQKILAQAGIASRRHAEELITEGRVQVNGQIVKVLGTKADPLRDHIRVDGKLLQGAERLRYFLFNKPRGYVTTVSDPEGRPTVMHFFAKMGERLYPVGRLDFQSEGLLLVTNDGELANNLTRAAHGVEKTYIVKVAGQPNAEMLERLRSGVAIERGRHGEGNKVRTAPARIQQIRAGDNPWFEVVLIEGRNRELRKMFEEIGHHVEKIRRVGYGPLILDVEPGAFRELSTKEVDVLRLTAAGKIKPRRVKATYMLPKEAGLTTEERIAKVERRKKPFRPRDDREPRSEGRSFGPPRDRRTAPPAGGGFTRPRTERPFEQRSTLPPAQRSETGGRSFERPSRPRVEGDKPRFERPAPGRPSRPPFVKREGQSQDRPPRAQFGKREFPSKERPSRLRTESDKPRFERPPQNRPASRLFIERDDQSQERPSRPPSDKREPRPRERSQDRSHDRAQEHPPSRPFRKDSAKPAGTGRSSGAAGKPRFTGGRSKPSFGAKSGRSGSGPSRFKGKGTSGPPRNKRSGPPRGGKRPGGK